MNAAVCSLVTWLSGQLFGVAVVGVAASDDACCSEPIDIVLECGVVVIFENVSPAVVGEVWSTDQVGGDLASGDQGLVAIRVGAAVKDDAENGQQSGVDAQLFLRSEMTGQVSEPVQVDSTNPTHRAELMAAVPSPTQNEGISPIPHNHRVADDEDTKPTGNDCTTRGPAMTTTDTNLETPIEGDRWSPALAEPPKVFLRIAVGVTAAFVACCLAVMTLLIGVTATTGCLFSCDDRNLLLGIPALAATAALTTLGLVALWWALVDRYWATTLKVLIVAGSIGAGALITGTLATA